MIRISFSLSNVGKALDHIDISVREGRRYLPGLDKVPVGQMLGLVVGIGRARPVHQVKVDIVNAQVLEGGRNAILDPVVPGVVELGGNPDLVAGHARIANAGTNFGFVAVGQGCVNVTIALQQGVLDGHADFIGLGLPSSQADGGDLVASVEGISLSREGEGERVSDRVCGDLVYSQNCLLGVLVRHYGGRR